MIKAKPLLELHSVESVHFRGGIICLARNCMKARALPAMMCAEHLAQFERWDPVDCTNIVVRKRVKV